MLNKIATTALFAALSIATASVGVANADTMSYHRMQSHMMMGHHHHMSMMEQHHMMMKKRMMMKKHMMHHSM